MRSFGSGNHILIFIFEHSLAFNDSISDLANQQLDGADGVIIGGDHIINHTGIAVGVNQCNHRDSLQVGFMHGSVFAHGINNKNQVRNTFEGAHTREAGLKFLDAASDEQTFFFGQSVNITGFDHFFESIKFRNTNQHGRPVGQHTAQPAFGHVGHAAADGFFSDGFLCLAFGADEHDHAALGDSVTNQVVGAIQKLDSLLQVNNMDAVALGENIGAHQRIPFVGAVTEMNTTFQQGFHRNY